MSTRTTEDPHAPSEEIEMIEEPKSGPKSPGNGRSHVLFGRGEILLADDLPTEDVRIPEWEKKGGPEAWVRVRGLTGRERDKYEVSITIGKGKDQTMNVRNARAKLLVMCIVDETGQKIFNEADISALGEKSAAGLERLFDVATRLSGLSKRDVEELTEDFE